MRFVAVKSVDQQGAGVQHKTRTQTIKQRTMMLNAVRAHLADFVETFTKATGCAPRTFLTRQRMEMAARLMGSQVFNPQQVALMTGYGVYNSFDRACKRHWGIAPAHFRNTRLATPQTIELREEE